MKKKWFRTMDLVDDAFIEEADPNRQVKTLTEKANDHNISGHCCLSGHHINRLMVLPAKAGHRSCDR